MEDHVNNLKHFYVYDYYIGKLTKKILLPLFTLFIIVIIIIFYYDFTFNVVSTTALQFSCK